MEITSRQLLAYRSYTEVLESLDTFADWLNFGDFMELLSTRASIEDQVNADQFNDRERELLEELDARMSEVLSDADVKQLQRESRELPVREWWR